MGGHAKEETRQGERGRERERRRKRGRERKRGKEGNKEGRKEDNARRWREERGDLRFETVAEPRKPRQTSVRRFEAKGGRWLLGKFPELCQWPLELCV